MGKHKHQIHQKCRHHYLLVLVYLYFLLYGSTSFAKTIRFGIYHSPPFNSVGANGVSGEDVELAKSLAKKLSMEADIIGCPVVRCLEMMRTGKLDIMFGLFRYPERENYMFYLNPPHIVVHDKYQIYARKDNSDIKTVEQLQGKLVGYLRGAKVPDFLAEIEIYEFEDMMKLVTALNYQRVDFVLGLESSIDSAIAEKNFSDVVKTDLFVNYEVKGFVTLSKKSPLIKQSQQLSNALTELLEPQ